MGDFHRSHRLRLADVLLPFRKTTGSSFSRRIDLHLAGSLSKVAGEDSGDNHQVVLKTKAPIPAGYSDFTSNVSLGAPPARYVVPRLECNNNEIGGFYV